MVRAGNRTYYFDVKTIRNNSRYITITESKRKFDDSGNPVYLKHKIFLYHEDFEKFTEGLREAIQNAGNGEPDSRSSWKEKRESLREAASEGESDFTNIDFDDLEDK